MLATICVKRLRFRQYREDNFESLHHICDIRGFMGRWNRIAGKVIHDVEDKSVTVLCGREGTDKIQLEKRRLQMEAAVQSKRNRR